MATPRSRSPLKSHYVDLTAQSALPWGVTLEGANTEQVVDDSHEGGNAARVLDMKNVLPTTFGYTSFFGERDIQLPPVSLLADDAFMYDTPTGRRIQFTTGVDGLRASFDGSTWDDAYTALNTANTLAGIQTDLGDLFAIVASTASITASNILTSPLVENTTPAAAGLTLLHCAPEQRDSRDQTIYEGTIHANFTKYVDWVGSTGAPLTDGMQATTDSTLTVPVHLAADTAIAIYPIDAATNQIYSPTVYRSLLDLPTSEPVTLDPATSRIVGRVDLATLSPAVGDVIHVGVATYTVATLPFDPAVAATALAAQLPTSSSSYRPATAAVGASIVFGFTLDSDYYTGASYAYVSDGTPLAVTVDTAATLSTMSISEGSGYNSTALVHSFPATATAGVDYIAVDVAPAKLALGGNIGSRSGFSQGDSFIIYVDGVATEPLLTQGDLWIYAMPKNSLGYAFNFGRDSGRGNATIEAMPVHPANLSGILAATLQYPTSFTQGTAPVYTRLDLAATVPAGMDIGIKLVKDMIAYSLPRQAANVSVDLTTTPANTTKLSNNYPPVAWAIALQTLVTAQSNAVKLPTFSQLDYAVARPYALSYSQDLFIVRAVLGYEATVLGSTQAVYTAYSGYVARADVQGSRNTSVRLNLPVMPQLADYQYGVQYSTPWTKAILRNKLYLYRQGMGGMLTVNLAGDALEMVYPTFANMQFVQGISAAKGRMLMWDSDNAVYRSSVLDALDFTPSIATQATVHKVDALKGDIVTIVPMGDNYVIYGSASIILAQYTGTVTIFQYKLLTAQHGIYHARAVTSVAVDTHAAYLDNGLHMITAQGIKPISNEVSEYLASSNIPVRLDFLSGRYLAISAAPALPTTSIEQVRNVAGRNLFDALRIDSIPGSANNYDWQLIDFAGGEVNHDWLYTVTAALAVTPKGLAAHQAKITRENPAAGMALVPTMLVRTPYIYWVFKMVQLAWVVNVYLTTDKMKRIYGTEPHLELTGMADSFVNPEAVARNAYAGDTAMKFLEGLRAYNVHSIPAHFAANVLHTWSNVPLNNPYDPTTGDMFATFALYLGNSQETIPKSVYSHIGSYGEAAALFTPAGGLQSPLANQIPAGSVGIVSNGTLLTFTIAEALKTLAAAATVLPLQGFDLPPVALAAGHFMGVQGQTASIPPVFNRTLLLDIQLGTWGSCDVPVRCMFDYSPVNAPTQHVGVGGAGKDYTIGYDDFALKLSAIKADGTLVTFTPDAQDSFLTVGKVGFFEQYLTRLTEVRWDVISSLKAAISVKSSVDGTRIDGSMGKDTKGDGMFLRTTRVGKWFLLTLSGNFSVKGVSFKGTFGGKR